MVTVTVENVTNVAPELAEQDDERIEFFIEYARGLINEGKFETEARARLAISLLAAHYLTVSPSGGTGGPDIASESLGDLSVSYASASNGAGGLTDTSYGVMYQSIAGTVLTTPMLI